MAVKFNLKRDPTAGLCPKGVHRFVIEKAEERRNKDGSGSHVALQVRPYVRGQKFQGLMFEILSEKDTARFRVEQFFNAVGAPLDGEATVQWFTGKSGYMNVKWQDNQETGLPEAKVAAYLTEEQAEKMIEKQAAKAGTSSTQTSSAVADDDEDDDAPVKSARSRSRKPVAVAELDDDEDGTEKAF